MGRLSWVEVCLVFVGSAGEAQVGRWVGVWAGCRMPNSCQQVVLTWAAGARSSHAVARGGQPRVPRIPPQQATPAMLLTASGGPALQLQRAQPWHGQHPHSEGQSTHACVNHPHAAVAGGSSSRICQQLVLLREGGCQVALSDMPSARWHTKRYQSCHSAAQWPRWQCPQHF